jgi:hypothetical protein
LEAPLFADDSDSCSAARKADRALLVECLMRDSKKHDLTRLSVGAAITAPTFLLIV